MRYVAQVVGWARKGHGGEDGADPGAVGWISFRHSTARPNVAVQDGSDGQTYLFDAPVAGDPHMHIHNFLMNLVVTADGRIGSLDSRALTDARVKEFGAYFQAVLADELRRIGVRVAYDADWAGSGHTGHSRRRSSEPSASGRSQILRKAKTLRSRSGAELGRPLGRSARLDIVEEASAEGRLGKMKTRRKAHLAGAGRGARLVAHDRHGGHGPSRVQLTTRAARARLRIRR